MQAFEHRKSRRTARILFVGLALMVLSLTVGKFHASDEAADATPISHLAVAALDLFVPGARAEIQIFPKFQNNCESSGCHDGLKVVEQIHPFFSTKCVDCHGGNAQATTKTEAHPPRPANFGDYPLQAGTHSTNSPAVEKRGPAPYRQGDPTNADHSDAAMLAYRRFLNPGDLLVADQGCGTSACHQDVVDRVKKSLHATMAGLMNGIYYVNGHPDASAGTVGDFARNDTDKTATMAVLLPNGAPLVDANFDSTIEGTVPTLAREVPRNDEALRNADKTDPLGMATFYIQTDCARCHIYTAGNKTPGTYHSTGCTACHTTYANEGFSQSLDGTVPENETDHPLRHKIVKYSPIEQCAHCHNRGARHTQRFLGFRERPQGDQGSRILNENADNTRTKDLDPLPDGTLSGGRAGGFYPSKPLYMKPGDMLMGRPYPSLPSGVSDDPSVVKGKATNSLWRRDMRVNETAADNRNPFWIVDEDRTNNYDETPPDLHAEAGMICVDCHTKREMHGDGHIYTDRFHKVEITCESCHGTASAKSDLKTRFGNPVSELFVSGGTYFQKLKGTGVTLQVPQLKDAIDAGSNPNALGPSHAAAHDRLECYACHATWHDQCNSCHMITSYDTVRDPADSNNLKIREDYFCDGGTRAGLACSADSDCPNGSCPICPDDKGCFFQRSHMDNTKRNATQGQPRFVTTYDQLILGINNKGRIQNFHTSGQATLFANKVVGGTGAEAGLSDGNFLEFRQCATGPVDTVGAPCKVDADCGASGTCPARVCRGGPFATGPTTEPEAEGQCKQCTAGSRTGELCSVDSDCGSGGACGGTGGTLVTANVVAPNNRICFGGTDHGNSCHFDPQDATTYDRNNPTPTACVVGGGTCGVRMSNFVFSTFDGALHLPSMPINPMFPHTVRKIPRNCDNCHPNTTFTNLDQVNKALGIGTGMAPVVDPAGPRQVSITRRVRVFTNGKGDLNVNHPATGALHPGKDGSPISNGEQYDVKLDQFIDVTFSEDPSLSTIPVTVNRVTQLRPTTHVNTKPLDATAIEKVINNPQQPQSPIAPAIRSQAPVNSRVDAFVGSVVAKPPVLLAPTPGMTLQSNAAEFAWDANGRNVQQWYLYVGSTPGTRDVVNIGPTQSTVLKVGTLPLDGRRLYVTLWYREAGVWQTVISELNAAKHRAARALINKIAEAGIETPAGNGTPTPTQAQAQAPATTSGGKASTLTVGAVAALPRAMASETTRGAERTTRPRAAANTGGVPASATGATVRATASPPTHERAAAGAEVSHAEETPSNTDTPAKTARTTTSAADTDADTGTPDEAALSEKPEEVGSITPNLLTPHPEQALRGSSATFAWTANRTEVDEWWFYLGSAPGTYDIFDSGPLGGTRSVEVNKLPTDGTIVHVTLWHRRAGETAWQPVHLPLKTTPPPPAETTSASASPAESPASGGG